MTAGKQNVSLLVANSSTTRPVLRSALAGLIPPLSLVAAFIAASIIGALVPHMSEGVGVTIVTLIVLAALAAGGGLWDVRRLICELRPPALDEQGLVGAIQNFGFSIADFRLDVTAPDGLPLLPAAVEVAAYRIATEAITNVIRHAHATTCVVTIATIKTSGVSETPEVLRIAVIDDGIGIDSSHPIGVGLRSMRERAEELGGTLTIESAIGKGTTIIAQLPIQNPKS
jgi:signal transduction histidine kinase